MTNATPRFVDPVVTPPRAPMSVRKGVAGMPLFAACRLTRVDATPRFTESDRLTLAIAEAVYPIVLCQPLPKGFGSLQSLATRCRPHAHPAPFMFAGLTARPVGSLPAALPPPGGLHTTLNAMYDKKMMPVRHEGFAFRTKPAIYQGKINDDYFCSHRLPRRR